MPAGDRSLSDDPLEPVNRLVLDANTALDNAFIKPVAEIYRQNIPLFVRDRIRSTIDNLTEPRIFVNDLLQRRADAAGTTFNRFFINTIVGVGGMFDLATKQGFPKQSGDFGQTLYVWGMADGPYLVLLFFGPSNLRDAFGLGVDLFTTPPALIVTGHAGLVAGLAVGAADGVDLRSRNIESLDEIIASALDYYSPFEKYHTASTTGAAPRGAPGSPRSHRSLSIREDPKRGHKSSVATTPVQDHRADRRRAPNSSQRTRESVFDPEGFCSVSVCCRRLSIRAFGPPDLRIAPNSDRLVASSLIVPER